MSFDFKIFYFFNNWAGQNEMLDYIFIFLAEYLEYFLILAFFLFLVFWKKYSLKDKIKFGIFGLGSAIIARFVMVEIIRFLVHRPRPFLIEQVHQLVQESSYSFPSGHATFYFALATAVYVLNKKIGAAFFLIAGVISLSRVIVGVHWPSDILAGMFLGIIITILIKNFLTKRGLLQMPSS